jgi:excinuclease UvrABC nuclease subunit
MRKYYDPTADWPSCKFLGADIFLPKTSGVYVVVGESHTGAGEPMVYYVGQSVDMRRRWKDGHHKALPLMREGAHTIRFFETPKHKQLESKLIAYYEPIHNLDVEKVLNSTSGYFRFNAEEW